MSDQLNHAKELKDRGNKEFSKKDYGKAIDCYTQAIDELIKDNLVHQPDELILVSVLYCNRAACYISLSEFQKAHDDCIECLVYDPINYKAKFRKAISLIGLDLNHKQAYDLFVELSNDDKISQLLGKPLKDELTNTQSILLQQEGKYDLMTLPFDLTLQESLHLQNYIGPVIIKKCLDNTKKGRGMFLTRDVKAGELLLVEKAFAYVFDDKKAIRLKTNDFHATANTVLKTKLKIEIEKKMNDSLLSMDDEKMIRLKLAYLYQNTSLQQSSSSSSSSSLSSNVPNIEWYFPKYKNQSNHHSININDHQQLQRMNLNDSNGQNSSSSTNKDFTMAVKDTDSLSTTSFCIDDIITFNSFDFEVVSEPDAVVREAIVKTISFLTSEYGTSRRDMQIPLPATRLQEFILCYDSIAHQYQNQSLSSDHSNNNQEAVVKVEKIRTTMVDTENGPVKYYFQTKLKDTDYNCSRDRSQQQNHHHHHHHHQLQSSSQQQQLLPQKAAADVVSSDRNEDVSQFIENYSGNSISDNNKAASGNNDDDDISRIVGINTNEAITGTTIKTSSSSSSSVNNHTITDLTHELINEAISTNQLNTPDNLGCTALHHAVMTNNHKIVQLLLATQTLDINAQDAIGYTALHYASGQYYHKEILNELCCLSVKNATKNSKNSTSVIANSSNGSSSNGSNSGSSNGSSNNNNGCGNGSSNSNDSSSSSSSSNSSNNSSSKCTLNINVFNHQYLTPLYLAATLYNIKAMFILLKAGADPLLGHPYSLMSPSPMQYAIDNEYKQHLQMYEAAGYNTSSSSSSSSSSSLQQRQKSQSQGQGQRGIGLWLLTSFFNHGDNSNNSNDDNSNISSNNTNGNNTNGSYSNSNNSNNNTSSSNTNTNDGNNNHNNSTPVNATTSTTTTTNNTTTITTANTNITTTTTTTITTTTANTVNTVRVFIGQFMFIYADRDLKKGEELLITYSQNRDELKDNWGIARNINQ